MRNGTARTTGLLLAGMIALALGGCGGRMPDTLGATSGQLAPCPASPNCVSSLASDAQHEIAPFRITGEPSAAWAALEAELRGRERVEIVTQSSSYLHAVFTTAIMRYRDDVEFLLQADLGIIAVRSASRVGYGDMDANRNRIESLRTALAERGVIEQAASE